MPDFEGDQGFAVIRLLDLQQVACAEIPSPTPAAVDPFATFPGSLLPTRFSHDVIGLQSLQ